MTSTRSRLSASRRQRQAVILLILGVIGGYVICYVITSLVRRGQRHPCTLPLFGEKEASGGHSSLHVAEEQDANDDQVTATKQLLFVGVMTSRRYLRTRARAIQKTWGAALNGSLLFFVGRGEEVKEGEEEVGEGQEKRKSALPVHILQDVPDNEYPPQRKVFAMLDFMHRAYGQRYQWFLRADDDLFVDVRRMRTLLASLNSSLPLYVGHPGTGRPEDFGRLGLPAGFAYCMGGTGVVLSSALLTSLSGALMTCTHNTMTKHEDSELGRCVYNTSRLSCLQSGQIYPRFKQNYDDTSGAWVRKALGSSQPYVTFHPVKDVRYMYDIAAQQGVQRITELQGKVRQLTAMISCMDIYSKAPEWTEVTTCVNGTCFRRDRTGLCESELQRTRDVLFERFNNGTWFLIHQNTFYTLWKYQLRKPVSFGGVWEGMTNVLRHLSAHVKARDNRSRKKSKQVVLGSFYKRVIPAAGVEYVAFVRGTSSAVRPYVIRQSFDDIVVVQKQ